MKKITLLLLLLLLLLLFALLDADFNFSSELKFGKGYPVSVSDNFVSADSLIINMSRIGLEIYKIQEDGEIEKKSELELNHLYSFGYHENYIYASRLYFGTNPEIAVGSILKIDISDINNPVLAQSIEVTDPMTTILYFNGFLFCGSKVYDAEQLAVVSTHTLGNNISKLSESYLYSAFDNDGIDVYNMEAPLNPILTWHIPSNEYFDGNAHLKSIDESRIVAFYPEGFVIFNYINNEWIGVSETYFNDYLVDFNCPSFISIVDEKLVVSGAISSLTLYDLSTEQPVLLDFLQPEINWGMSSSIAWSGDYLYASTDLFGIIKFSVTEAITEVSKNYVYQRPFNGCLDRDKLYYRSFDYIYSVNLENTLNPIYAENNIFTSSLSFTLLHDVEKLIVKKSAERTFEVYSVSDPDTPVLISNWGYLEGERPSVVVNEEDSSLFYLYDRNSGQFDRMEFSDSGELTVTWSTTIDQGVRVEIYNGVIYSLSYSQPGCLKIYSGLEDECLNLEDTFENITYSNYPPFIGFYDNFLYFHAVGFNSVFYDITEPYNPVYSGSLSKKGKVAIGNDLLIVNNEERIYVFEKNFEQDNLAPISDFYAFDYTHSILPYRNNNQNYIIAIEYSCIELFSYDYEVGTGEFVLKPIINNLSNHPNPFNPSGAGRSPNTTISYNLKSDTKVELEIYNVKGQKIKTLVNEKQERGEHSQTWDGRDNSGEEVSSGVYLYKLKTDYDETVSRMMLIK